MMKLAWAAVNVRTGRGISWLVAGALLVTVGVLLGFNAAGFRDRLAERFWRHSTRSVAVLPFQNLSGDPRQDYLVDGMTDAVITGLARVGGMTVISRTSTMTYRGSRKRLPEIGRELRADVVVEGSVVQAGDRWRITAQLIELPEDKHLWAQSYEHEAGNILTLEDEVAADISRQVQERVSVLGW